MYYTVSFDLEPGYHTFYWSYFVTVFEDEEANNLSMKIDFIEIEGIKDAETECKKCVNSHSQQDSYECDFCVKNYYFDTTYVYILIIL
jgi:hypothetical protein